MATATEKKDRVYRCSSCGRVEEKRFFVCNRCGLVMTARRCDRPRVLLPEGPPAIHSRGEKREDPSSALARLLDPDGERGGDDDEFDDDPRGDDGGNSSLVEEGEAHAIGDVEAREEIAVLPTGVETFDLMASGHGGPILGKSYMLAGEEGSGKSRLLRLVGASLIETNKRARVFYGCSEETEKDVAGDMFLAKLLTDRVKRKFFIRQGQRIEPMMDSVYKFNPDLLIVDSLGEYVSDESPQPANSNAQIVAVTKIVHRWTRETNGVAFIIAQLNGDGAVAGPRAARHATDATLWMKKEYAGGVETKKRRLSFGKNRGNAPGQSALFEMTTHGIREYDPEAQDRRPAPHRVVRRHGHERKEGTS